MHKVRELQAAALQFIETGDIGAFSSEKRDTGADESLCRFPALPTEAQAYEFLGSLLADAQISGESSSLFDAKIALATISAGHFSDLIGAVKRATAKSKVNLHVDLNALKQARTAAVRQCNPPQQLQVLVGGGNNAHKPHWTDSLIINRKDGEARAILGNAITALRGASEWEGVLAHDEFSVETVTRKPTPWGGAAGTVWTDQEDRLTADWLHHNGIFVSADVAAAAVQTVARDRMFHPVREYLDALKWDGVERLSTWLAVYVGATQNAYSKEVGALWLISAVARIYQPGAKVDCAIILEGDQGLKKSTVLRKLTEPWFTDEIADLGTKDASLQTQGVWLIEIAELSSMSRSDVSRVKAFISRATDRFRPPYGRRPITSPRQCVFAGSVNSSIYLRDETGNRRFWPVACTRALIDEVARDRDQLWAEAVFRYRRGDAWWLDSINLTRLAALEQADRYEGDPWDDLINGWLTIQADPNDTSVPDILLGCIEKSADRWLQSDMNRVARCLVAAGWERYKGPAIPDGKRPWRYRRVSR